MTQQASRREFLKRASILSMVGSGAPLALNLAAISQASAATASDYKALVCVFLYGGNDNANTVIPYDATNYALYQSLRSTLAYDNAALAGTVLTPLAPLAAGRQYALAPQLAPLAALFNTGKAAVMLNVGTLVQPTTKAQYLARSVPLPPKLFSHNDQQSIWQSLAPEGAVSGWGGRLADLYLAGNANATFTCINVSGNAAFLSGNTAVQYQISSTGPVAFNAVKSPLFGSAACSSALQAINSVSGTDPFTSEYSRVVTRAIASNAQLTAALTTAPTLATPFTSSNPLAQQLKMVARMIGSSSAVGAKRQVFFVSLGGFDTHASLTSVHPGLLTSVADALNAFYAATVEMGVASQVTTFTASDFGRTLTSNGDGSDHGWGSMHFVLGGAVHGQTFYGTPPVVANNGPDDVGQGRLIPTTSVDQLGATLGAWLGTSATDLLTIFPDLANFNAGSRNLGFV